MKYKDYIRKLSQEISSNVVNLKARRGRRNPPTQAFSNFLIHNEQGEWAEALFFDSLKRGEIPYIPVRYGRAEKIIAGDLGFKDFYYSYQNELDTIGKRPDILIFNPKQYRKEWSEDISEISQGAMQSVVPLAVAGFEVRSSSYLTKKFVPTKGRPFLSFTPKVEDLILVLRWIDTFNVPHYYVQVFFDSIYIISFKTILILLKNATIEERAKKIKGVLNNEPAFTIEKNPKNQYKETIHIFLNNGRVLSSNIEGPKLIGNKKELARGRILHYVTFNGGRADIDAAQLLQLIEMPF